MAERTCLRCGADITHRRSNAKFCRKNCATMWYQQHETKICKLDGCENKVRVWGMCVTHYNQTRPNRHRKRQVACVVCGRVVERRVDNSRLDSHCCSVECRRLRQFGVMTNGTTYDWNQDAKRRARAAGCQVVEDVDRIAVLERDGWTCYLCGADTRVTEDPFDPASATVDHVIPLSAGGPHTMANVRCACLRCNCSKADRISPAA